MNNSYPKKPVIIFLVVFMVLHSLVMKNVTIEETVLNFILFYAIIPLAAILGFFYVLRKFQANKGD